MKVMVFPMSEGRAPDQPLAPRRPPTQGRHVGLGPGLVDEHQPFQVDAALTRLPAGALAGDVGPLLGFKFEVRRLI